MTAKMKRKVKSDDDDDGPEGGAKKQLLDTIPEFSTGKWNPVDSINHPDFLVAD